MFLFSPSGPATSYNSQFQSVSGSDAADLKNNLTQTTLFEYSDSTEIGIPFSPNKITLMEDVSQHTNLVAPTAAMQ